MAPVPRDATGRLGIRSGRALDRRHHHDGECREEQLCGGRGAGRGGAGGLCAPPDGFRGAGEWGVVGGLKTEINPL
jgi:hypothetical protein